MQNIGFMEMVKANKLVTDS
jgi:hypothetical protein